MRGEPSVNPIRNSGDLPEHPWKVSRRFLLVALLGVSLRIYLMAVNPLFNPDGFLYIQQAKAIYFGLFDSVVSCYEYLSPYPIFVAGAYPLIGDWVLAGELVSLLFATLTFFPLYWTARRFFNETISSLALLAFVMIPSYVIISREILRGPPYWFFSAMGVYLFVLNLEARNGKYLLAASLCFVMAAWARIEGSLFFLISAGYLIVMVKREGRWREILLFLSPALVSAFLLLLYVLVYDVNLMELLKPERILSRPLHFMDRYNELRDLLKVMIDEEPEGISAYFFKNVRHLLWFLAIAVLVVQAIEDLFYVFALILIVGWVAHARNISRDRRLLYLSLLTVFAGVVLYAQIIYNWVMTSRFVILMVLPSFVFMAAGIETIGRWMNRHVHFKKVTAWAVVGILIAGIALPKILRANYVEDKLIFREIGEFIAVREQNARPVSVAGAFKHARWIHFFANVKSPFAPCFDDDAFLDGTGAAVLDTVRQKGYDYFVWDQNDWEAVDSPALSETLAAFFVKRGEWESESLGKMILYQRKPAETPTNGAG